MSFEDGDKKLSGKFVGILPVMSLGRQREWWLCTIKIILKIVVVWI
jgi:hypothetical protein